MTLPMSLPIPFRHPSDTLPIPYKLSSIEDNVITYSPSMRVESQYQTLRITLTPVKATALVTAQVVPGDGSRGLVLDVTCRRVSITDHRLREKS